MGNVKKRIRGRAQPGHEKAFRDVAEIARHFKSSKTESGTIALFAGPSGTGKTKAVKALASEIGLNVYRIDLAAVVNKYIGETEKNLVRVLETADALFGQRTEIRDAHDRYANDDTNYLLQRIEQYSGLVILASNSKKHLDQALLHRVRVVIEFPN